nr:MULTISPECIES: IS3 family transposase [unclassified Moraxella]
MEQLMGQYSISKAKLCQLFGICRSTYYVKQKPKLPTRKEINLRLWVKQAFDCSKGSAGSRSIAAMVSRAHQIKLTRYKARQLMRAQGLISRQSIKHRYRLADQAHTVHDNLLKRQFAPAAPNQVWVSDVTYIHTKAGFCYLAVVMDLYARHIIGFAMSDRPNSELTTKALIMAYTIRFQPTGVLFHSDQGSHYTSRTFADTIARCKMTHSMSRKGNCWDNAPTERFFRSFKYEWMPKHGYENIHEAKVDVASYILGYYSQLRPHSFNNYLSPVEKERQFFNKTLLGVV